MIKEDVIKLYNTIQMEKGKGSVKFRYLLLKNETVIKHEITTLSEVEKDIEKIREPFIKKRNDLIKTIGVLNPKTNNYEIPPKDTKKVNEFLDKLKPITEKYKKIIDEHDKKYTEYLNMLKEDVSGPLNVVEIKVEDLPQELKTESMELFMKLGILK